MGNWLQALDHEDKKSIAMLLCFVPVKELSFTETRAVELTVKVTDKNEKTVRRPYYEWGFILGDQSRMLAEDWSGTDK